MALLFRHFFATSFRNQYMLNSKSVPTNAVQGVVRHTFKLLEITRPSNVVIVWDMGRETIRNEWFEDYKKNRELPPDELIPQFDMVKDVMHDLGFYQMGSPGFEADDVIGTLSQHINNAIVVSGDRDLLQILKPNDNNHLWLTKKGFSEYNVYDYATFVNEYGITPEQFIDVKALMGDPGDGYRGVGGIGEKTAFKLIKEHANIETLIARLDELSPSIKKKIIDDFDSLEMSLKLATIINHVPIELDSVLQKSPYDIDIRKSKEILEQHELTISSRYLDSLDL